MPRAVALMLVLLLSLGLSSQAGAFAYRGQQAGSNTGATDSGEPIAWHPHNVTMGLNFGAPWNDAARLALQQWNASGADFTWHAEDGGAAPCVNDGINSSGWGERACSGEWGSVIATTRVSMTRIGGKWYISDTDVVFNAKLQFNRYSGPLRYGADGRPVYDFIRIALHEFGHAAGLLHPDAAGQQVEAVMNSGRRSLALDHLQADDRQGLRHIYADGRTTPEIYFDGFDGYHISDGEIAVTLGELYNHGAADSGPLTLEIRASDPGDDGAYFVLGTLALEPLAAGTQRHLGRLSSRYTTPPGGLHGISLALLDSNGGALLYHQAVGYLDRPGISAESDAPSSASSGAAQTGGSRGGGGPLDAALLLIALLAPAGRKWCARPPETPQ